MVVAMACIKQEAGPVVAGWTAGCSELPSGYVG